MSQQPPSPPESPEKPAADASQQTASDGPLVSAEQVNQQTEKDAALMRRRFSIKRMLTWLMLVVFLLVVFVAGVVGFISTDRGTRYFLHTISDMTKITLNYDKGNLISGLWIKHVTIPLEPHKTLYVDKARVKLGWRQLFEKETVHLRDAYIHELKLEDINPPSGKPFHYFPIKLPVKLLLSHAQVDRFVYAKATRQDVLITDVKAKDLRWVNDTLSLHDGTVTYGKYAVLHHLAGKMVFDDKTWPIHATADLSVPFLSQQQFSKFEAVFFGSLAQLQANVSGKWRDDEVTGTLVAYPVEKRLPYQANFQFNQLHLPYLMSENIQLDKGALALKGNLNQTFVGLDTNIAGKHIPNGRYLASGRTDFHDEITLQSLVANTAIGKLKGKGRVGWQTGLAVDFDGHAHGINSHRYLSKTVQPYVPDDITGSVTLALRQPSAATHQGHRNKNAQPMRIHAEVIQAVGDTFRGDIELENNQIRRVTGKLVAKQLPKLPQGDYDIDVRQSANQTGHAISVNRLNYRGILGQLSGTVGVNIPRRQQPLEWQADIRDADINLAKYDASLPVIALSGDVSAQGTINGQQQSIEMTSINMTAHVEQKSPQGASYHRKLSMLGQGKTSFQWDNGKSSNIALRYAGKLDTAGLPSGNLLLDIAQQGRQWQLNRVVHHSPQGSLDAKGFVTLADTNHQGLAWQLSGQVSQFNPAIFLPAYPGRVSGNWATRGVWQDDRQKIEVSQLDLTGNLKDKPLSASGVLDVDLRLPRKISGKTLMHTVNAFRADNFQLTWANNHIKARGNQDRVALAVNINTLEQLYPAISGRLNGTALIDSPKSQAPKATVDLIAQAFRVGDTSINNGKITGTLNGLGRQPSQLHAELQDVTIGDIELHALDIDAQGVRHQHRVTFNAQHKKADIQGQLMGSLDQHQTWQGQLQHGRLTSDLLTLKQQAPARVTLNSGKQHYTVSAHCWRSQRAGGSFCLDRDFSINRQGGQVYASIKSLDSAFFSPFLPDGMAWEGKLEGNTRLNWQQHQPPRINALFYTDNGTIGLAAEDPQDDNITLAYKRLSVIVASHAKGLKVRLDAKTQSAGNGYIDAIIDPKHPDKTINGAMVLDDIRLNVLRPFFPGVRSLAGTASLAGGMSGPLRGPQYYGNFKLKNGAITMLGVPVNLSDVNITSRIRGTQAKVTGSFVSGQGTGKLDGLASWKNGLDIQLGLTGQQLAVRQPPMLYAEINPDIQLNIKPYQREMKLTGNIDVVKGMVRPPEVDTRIIRQSSDVIVIHDAKPTADAIPINASAATLSQREANQIQQALQASANWKINTALRLKIAKQTYFNGFGASIPLTGQLNVTQSGRGKMQGNGRIEVGKRVPVTVFGQSLDLTRGKLRFSGNISKPHLDIEAVRKISGDEIGVRVKGSPDKPNIEVFNDAGLTEQQAMNALVTGRIEGTGNTTTESFQDSVNNAMAAAGLSVGLRGTRSFTNRIGRNFGLSSLTLDASGTDNDTNLNITGYLTPDLYLRYGVGVFTPVNKLTMRYQLSKRVYVEASSAIEKAIDVFYNWRF